MSEFKKLNLGSLVKLAVDSKGITNGSVNILSFEYDINSDIDKIKDYVENNDFPELKNEINDIKIKNDELENEIKDYAIQILALQNDTSLLNEIIEDYNSNVSQQYNNLITLINLILTKLEPKIIYKDKIIKQKEYIQTTITIYKGVKTIDEVRQEQSTSITYNRPKPKTGWDEYSDEWMIYYSFGKELFFKTKKQFNEDISKNRKPEHYGSLYRPEKFHKLYDK